MKQKYLYSITEERAMIEIEVGNGVNLQSVARRRGRKVSSVSRELSRNRIGDLTKNSRAAGLADRERPRRTPPERGACFVSRAY